ncbi:MAG: hypothetical protein P8Y45_03940 [Exilibacterium sp.]
MLRHIGNSFGGTGKSAAECVLDAAVNHALGGDSLIAAEHFGLEQRGVVSDL